MTTITNKNKNWSATATTTASIPTPATAGNILCLIVASDDYKTGDPSGWSLVPGGSQETYHGHYFWYKVSAGGETSVNYTIGSASRSAWAMFEIPNSSGPVDVSNGQLSTGGGANQATPTVTPTTGSRFCVATIAASDPTDFVGIGAWTNSFVEIDEIAHAGSGTRDIVAYAGLDFTGNGSTTISSQATIDPGAPDATSGIIAAFIVSAGGDVAVSVTGVAATSAIGGAPLVRGIDMVVTEAVAEIVSSSNVTTYDFGSVTLPPNQLIVVLAGVRGTVATGSIANVSGDTLSWTKKGSFTFNGGADTMYVHYARTPSKTTASVYRVDVTGDAGTGCIAYMFAVDGALESGDPIVQLGNGAAASTNATATFGAARDTNNAYLAAWFGALSSSNPANVSTPPGSWTEIGDNGFGTPTTNGSAAYRVKGETGTTVAFTNSTTTWGAIAAEIKTNLGTALNYTPSGIGATGTAGGVIVQASASYTLTGRSASSSVGAVSVAAAASYTLTGRSASSSVGNPTVSLGQDVSTTVLGRAATATVGLPTVTQSVNYTILGRLAAASVGSVSVATGNLSWSAVGGATTYRIYYGTTASNYSTFINAGNVLEYPISSLPFGANTTYYLMVRAWNGTTETDAWASEHVVLNGIDVSNPYLVFLSSGIGATAYVGSVTTGVGVQVPISLGGGTPSSPSFIGAVGTAFGIDSGTSKQSPALATTSGDYIFVTLNDYDFPEVGVSSVQDTAGNVYVLAGTVQSNDANHHQQTWYTPNPIVGNPANVVTVQFSGGNSNWVVVAQNVFRWPNATGIQFDTESSLSAPIGTNQTSATLTVNGANEIIVGEWAGWAGTLGAFSNGTATLMWQDASPADAASGYRLAATPGVYSIGVTNSSSSAQYAISAKSFRANGTASSTQSFVGNVVVTANALVPLVGRSATASVGTVIAGVTTAVQIVGQGATASVGGVTVQTQSGTSVNITGIQITSYLGLPRAFGGTLIWTAPPEGATSYKIYWGTTTGVYSNSLDVGNVTSYPLASLGLVSNRTYYSVITAINPAGESPISSEIILLNGGELPPPYTLAQVLGRSATASVGNVIARTNVDALLLGRQATAALGAVTVNTTGNIAANVSGVPAAASLGVVSVTAPVSVVAPSVLLTATLGGVVVVIPNQSANALVSGLSSTAYLNSNVTVIAPAAVSTLGILASASVGVPVASVSSPVAILGRAAVASAGSLTVQGHAVVSPPGLPATAFRGSATVSINSVTPVSGLSSLASLNPSLGFEISVEYPVTSVASLTTLGVVSITVAGDVSVGVAGIASSAAHGNVSVSGNANVFLSSSQLTTSLSSSAQVSCSIDVHVAGILSQSYGGVLVVNTAAGEAVATVTGLGMQALLGIPSITADANVSLANPYYLSTAVGFFGTQQGVDCLITGLESFAGVGDPLCVGDAIVICPSVALESIVGMVNAINVIPEVANIQGIGVTAALGKVYVRTHGGRRGRVDLKFPQQVRKLTFPKDYT